jgi:hypothetical protein
MYSGILIMSNVSKDLCKSCAQFFLNESIWAFYQMKIQNGFYDLVLMFLQVLSFVNIL